MKTYEQVDNYMQEIGLKYVKSSNEFIAGLAVILEPHMNTVS